METWISTGIRTSMSIVEIKPLIAAITRSTRGIVPIPATAQAQQVERNGSQTKTEFVPVARKHPQKQWSPAAMVDLQAVGSEEERGRAQRPLEEIELRVPRRV